MDETEDHPQASLQGETILIADDNIINLGVISDYLIGSGFNVLFARDGQTALEKAKQGHPDLILLEVLMPGLDGFETCRRLKADPELRAIPVIFITSLSDTAEKLNGFRSGGVDYITKPFQYEEVLARVRAHLSIRYMQKQLEKQNANLTQEVNRRKQTEQALLEARANLEKRVEERTMALKQANESLLVQIAEREQEEKVREALYQIAQAAISQGDMAELCRSIHEIVGQLMPAQNFFIALRDPSTNMVSYPYFVDQFDSAPGPQLCQGSLTSQVILTGRNLLISLEVREELVRDHGIRMNGTPCVDWLGVPLKVENRIIGMMAVQSYTEQVRYGEKELGLMEFVSTQVAMAIERKRSFEEIHKHLQRLSALHVIDTACTNNLGLDLTLGILIDQTIDQLKVDAADILLLSPDIQNLEFAVGRGFRSNFSRGCCHLQTSGTWAGQVVLERLALHLYDIGESKWFADFTRLFAEEAFVTYFGVPILANGQVKGVLEVYHRSPRHPSVEWLNFLNALATQAAIVIDNSNMVDALQRSNQELMVSYDATLEGWSYALELRDGETEGHSQRVTTFTLRLARALKVKYQDLIHIRRGALLHDIGKMGIPDRILLKPGPLDEAEWQVMRKHPVYAYEMLAQIPYLRPALDIPYRHHEKWDGSGYPGGLQGEEIPLAARIFAIVDVWDALSTDRPYRKAWKQEEILEYIQEQSGKQFDPAIVKAFLALVCENF